MNEAKKGVLLPLKHKVGQAAAVVGGLAMSGMAAAALDVEGVTTAISGQTSNVETIAVAVLAVLALIAGVSYLRRVIR